MSFSRKLGWLAKQSLGNSIASAGPAPALHMFNSMRCMSTRLFVGGLSYSTDDANLRDTFTEFGELTEAVVLVDRITGKSRGFGFVDYTTDESASKAISNMDGKELQGRHIRVRYAKERVARGFGGEPSPEA